MELTQEQKNKLAVEAGLVLAGLDNDGEQQYIGNLKAWNRMEMSLEIAVMESDPKFGPKDDDDRADDHD